MAQLVLVRDELDSGQLVIPFKSKQIDRGEFTYDMVTPKERQLSPQMIQFRDWILEHCQAA